MGRLLLRFDAARLEFVARVVAQVGVGRWTTAELVVDSGSNVTGLFAGVAHRGGVVTGGLPIEGLDFVGSRAFRPFLPGARLVFAGEGGARSVTVRLAILPDPGEGAGETAGVLGLDVLRDLGGTVHLDLPRGSGWVEW